MNWRFPPETPTEPGLYGVQTSTVAGDMPRFVRWHSAGAGWRLGVRREAVTAFYGPIPACEFPHADVDPLFAPPARDVPIPRAPKRRTSQDRRR